MKFFNIWIKHAILNMGCFVGDLRRFELGKAIESLIHVIIPPQIDHAMEDCEGLYLSSWQESFYSAWREV